MATQPAAPRSRARRRPQEAEREILEAARELLAERPAHEVTVSEIMARTSLSRKSFYVHFRDRHELITRLLRPLRAEADAMIDVWRRDPGTVGPVSKAVLRSVARLYAQHGTVLRALYEASGRDEEAARAWDEIVEPVIALAAEKIRLEMERGRVGGLDPQATARALVGMNLHWFFDRLVGKPGADVEPTVETLHTIWIRALYLTAEPPE